MSPTRATEPPAGLDPIEIATGLIFGVGAGSASGSSESSSSPRAALERVVLAALQRQPCVVSFSGGRDSSAVLAVATHVARREGLPDPIPVTNEIAGAGDADESEWQELVVRHLGLATWERLRWGSELDAVGPYAQRALRAHGLLWPFNAFFHVPLLEVAAGGSLLTGIGGDEQLGESRYARANVVLARRDAPRPTDARRLAFALAPGFVRAAALRRRAPVRFPWLTESGHREFVARWAGQSGREPRRYDRRVHWWRGLRSVKTGFESLAVLAADAGVRIEHPLAHQQFAAALASDREIAFYDRAGKMRILFGDLLPVSLLERRTKARFDEAFWNDHAREFAATWDGTGVPSGIVDPDALRREWQSDAPTAQSFMLAQAAWLARSASPAARP